jgi:hypothetical protein|tara:strand:+ start:140 stop:424 length:285 start_codon:yes stop_codon:yes gene_type:complete
MAQLTAGTAYNPKMGDGSRGVVQVYIPTSGGEDLTLYGSVNGVEYIKIKHYDASTIEEVVLCPYMAYSSQEDNHLTATPTGAVANSKVLIDETR